MIFSEETLRYPAACYCPSTLIHTVQHDIYRGNTKIFSIILLSFYINTYLNNKIFSEERLRYLAACYFPFTLIHTVQHDIFRGNTKISSIILLSFYINTYLYNMLLSEEKLRYPISYCCPSTLIHTCTIWYCQKKHWYFKQYVIVLLQYYIPVQYDIVRRNTKISSIILLSFYINTYLYNMQLSEESLRYPASYCCPSTLIHTWTIRYFQKKHWDIQPHVIFLLH
jgi:hypothetical protein